MSAKIKSPENILWPLDAAQAHAVDPAAHVWLNASAGTGKTQVLAARVLRLLLGGVSPDAILCITYTKAGAAEMAHRVHERLALWVGCSDGALRTDLDAIGLESSDRDLQALARTMFARVIDSPAGAIRVQTIHSFCQSLLASFPVEAAILPGFRLIEGGEASDLRGAVLADLFNDAGEEGARRRSEFGLLSRRLGEEAALKFVNTAAAFFQRRPAPRLAPPADVVRTALDLPLGDADVWVAEQLVDGVVNDGDVEQVLEAAQGWLTKQGSVQHNAKPSLAAMTAWLAVNNAARSDLVETLRGGVATLVKGEWQLRAAFLKEDDKEMGAAHDAAQNIFDAAQRLLTTITACRLADDLAAGWRLAADYAAALAHRKLAEGFAEFDDLIARTAALLANGELADWIRFKLDQRIDHLLIDEAQDTNADQWTIANGLTGEFFAGLGARDDDRVPSMFAVGDRKQAIFGFQGTDPVAFEAARMRFLALAEASDRPFLPVDLTSNFRSAPAVLGFVDAWLADGGVEAMGIAPPVARHDAFDGANKPGRVEIWPPLVVAAKSEGDDDEEEVPSGDDSLHAATDPASLKLAAVLADRVAGWIDHGLDGLAVDPGDVMILVRTRRALAARIVAQLQSRGVDVAGVDRFLLADPLAVKDLLAALRFMVQPDDEHSLAVLLVSPLIGWNHDQLYAETGARGDMPLRQWLGQSETSAAAAANARIAELRGAADLETPFRTLDRILSGPLQGRRAMAARLGAEANDAIDALLAEALSYETRGIPSLTGFLDHIDRAPRDIKRPSGGRGLVRVMTVHGSKGLQAPIVILADATADPSSNLLDVKLDLGGWRGLPLFRTSKDGRPPKIVEAWNAARAAQLEEHWRQFYVAATRPERLLVVTGTLAKADRPASDNSWYRHAETVMAALPHDTVDIGWESGAALRHSNVPGHWAKRELSKDKPAAAHRAILALPDWSQRAPPEEARPPRPLAPSRLGDDDAPQRPASGDRAAAIQHGVLLHALIERLPAIDPDTRAAAAERWLGAQAQDMSLDSRRAMADQACAVLAHPEWAAIFGPGSLAEAPFSAVIDGGLVIAGTVDRLLVTDAHVLVIDYKTGAHVPANAAAVPPTYLRQMAAYAAALGVIFPGRPVAAGLLYTAVPRLIALPAELLATHKPGLARTNTNLTAAPLEPDASTS